MKKATLFINPLCKSLEAAKNDAHAFRMAKYMKDHFDYFGIQAPIRKEITRKFLKENPLPKGKELMIIAKKMWKLPQREYQYIAMDFLIRKSRYLEVEAIDFLVYLITTKSWWDSVDSIASNLVGTYFELYPQEKRSYTQKWIHSENMWLQRTAIIFQLKYKNNLDEDLLFEHILICAGSKEFFIQKAIGWALRQYAKTQPMAVKRFVENNELKSLSKREALKGIIF